MRKAFLAGVALLWMGSGLWAQTTGGGNYPYLGTARSLSMAGAFTAVADDESTLFFNPAGLARLTQPKAHISGEVNSGDPDYVTGLYLWPNRGVQLGGALLALSASVGNRDDNVVQYTVGQDYNPQWSFGGTLKWQRSRLPGVSESAFSFDLGVLYRPVALPDWRFGLAVLDVSEPTFAGIGLQRRTVNLGVAWQYDPGTLLSLDLFDIGDHAQAFQVRLGGERYVTDNLVLRAGVAESDFSVGLGILYRDFTLDLGFRRVSQGPDITMLGLHSSF